MKFLTLLLPLLIVPLLFRGAEPTQTSAILVRLTDIQGFDRGQTLELNADGDLSVRTISDGKERIHDAKVPPNELKELLDSIPSTGIFDYHEIKRPGASDEGRPKIALTLPGRDPLVAEKWAKDEAPLFDRLYEKLLQLVETAVKARGTILRQEADSLRTARKIIADEFVGYSQGCHQSLNTATLTAADAATLGDLIQGPDLATEPTDEELTLCFDPHHSFLVTDRAGGSSHILVCLGCNRMVFQRGAHGVKFAFTESAANRLSAFFQRLNLPVRTSEDYSTIELDRRHHAK